MAKESRDLGEDPVRTFLNEKRFAVLATLKADGTVQQTVMWYLIDGDELLFNTASGRVKYGNLARDPRVSLCVEDGYRYVTISGTARAVPDQATAQADIHRLAVRYNGAEKAAEQMATSFSKQQRISYRVPLDKLIVNGFETQ
jgi:PPOX class probable F420-dependent enzyme